MENKILELIDTYIKEISIINMMIENKDNDDIKSDLMHDLLVNVNAVIDICYGR